MKLNKRLLTFLSALVLVCSVAAIAVSAADVAIDDYVVTKYASEQAKLDTMELILEENGSKLYIDRASGEIGFVDSKTGQVLLSNPYDIATSKASENIKNQLMSQLIIKYEDSGTEKMLDSYSAAACENQITVKKTKSGVRVEYIIGQQVTRRLVPRLIEKSRFEERILSKLDNDAVKLEFSIYYTLYDPAEAGLTDRQLREMRNSFPITEKMAVYVIDPKITNKELDRFEGYVKEYAPQYTFEMLDEDHELTEYEGTEKSPPLFRMALEYSIDEDGNLDVRLPANGIRFDETVYSLTNIQILPYFGAGLTANDGEIFIPDGSGAIIRPAEFGKKAITLTNMIYGQDYAYQKVSGAHQEIMHLPVYGVAHNTVTTIESTVDEVIATETVNPDTGATEIIEETVTKKVFTNENSSVGFLAIINEGDSLASITAENGGNLHNYFSAYTSFSPRPKDTYNLSESIDIGGNAIHTVVSDRKYTDSYRIKYVMLNNSDVAEASGVEDYYETNYVGMAKAYRDYLESEGVIERIEETDKDLPLFIESFGAIETTKRVASIPVTVMTELTTFDDVKAMAERLAEENITNVNFRLTGFANGGMISTAPYKLKFESVLGGNKGYQNLMEYANEKNITIYPDFDFSYLKASGSFDGISNDDLVKSMDNRYTSKRYYDSTMQEFVKTTNMVISPKSYSRLYEELFENFSKLSPNGISVSTLGSDLSSDFNEDDPYNREDAKDLVEKTLALIAEDNATVLSDAANAYSLKYVDSYLNVPLDASNYLSTSDSVPFMGMVLHGYKTFTGTAVNMAGDTAYQVLKAIENGSAVYFNLSYRNTNLLKESEDLNKYYSVGFDIWFEDLAETYKTLNEALSDCQTALIEDHEFMLAERVPSEEEMAADKAAEGAAILAKEEEEEKSYQKALKKLKLQARQNGLNPDAVLLDREAYIASIRAKEEVVEPTGEYVRTKYTTDEGKMVLVTYDNGVRFILNYNNFDVTAVLDGETYTIDALGFAKIK